MTLFTIALFVALVHCSTTRRLCTKKEVCEYGTEMYGQYQGDLNANQKKTGVI